MDSKQRNWLPIRQAVAEVAPSYEAVMHCTPAEATEHAWEAIWRRLRLGMASARARRWYLHFSNHKEQSVHNNTEVDSGFWYVLYSGELEIDWVAGEFSCFRDDGELNESQSGATANAYAHGAAWGVDVAREDLPIIGDANEMTNRASLDRYELRLGRDRGRPRKWDWEGALSGIVAEANSNPDGLPAGYGAQAEIARMLADWFSAHQSGQPTDSELQKRARLVLSAVETHRK